MPSSFAFRPNGSSLSGFSAYFTKCANGHAANDSSRVTETFESEPYTSRASLGVIRSLEMFCPSAARRRATPPESFKAFSASLPASVSLPSLKSTAKQLSAACAAETRMRSICSSCATPPRASMPGKIVFVSSTNAPGVTAAPSCVLMGYVMHR